MILEKGDVAALRLAEARGWFPTDAEVTAAGLAPAEYAERLRRLCSTGIIRGFKTTLVVPPLLGGDWVWAAVLASAKRDLGLANALADKLPFVSEIVLNASLPEKVGPNLAVLFYSRDFDKEADFIRNAPGIEYHEVYRVADYSFPVALPLSRDEKELVRYLIEQPESRIAEVGTAMERPQTWVRAKLDRLLWSDTNRTGVLRVLPELNWSAVENFGHFHFLIETGHGSEQLQRIAGESGFEVVLGARLYRDRYVQVEADVWGVADLLARVAALNQVPGIHVAGVVWNERTIVNSAWSGPLLG